ncbi:hypothetical protein A9Q81_11635 [Gammaproteobacteria bacterium 42_54_T18]|nr:hypothetical protein A9Q81_11635 [Gammaproteobacteria bacterium 42_54_T18]
MSGGDDDNEIEQTWGEKELAAVSAEKWNRYQTDLKGMEDIFIKDSQMTEADFKKASGYANTDTSAAFGAAPVISAGPGQGGNLATRIDSRYKEKSKVTASNLVASGNQTEDRHAAGLQSIIAAGNGQQVDAHNNLTRNASINLNGALSSAHNDSQKYQAKMNNIGTGIGVASYAAQSYAPAKTDYNAAGAAA